MNDRHRNRNPHRYRSARIALAETLESRRLLTTYYVDAHAPSGTHDGSTWSRAFTDLQQTLSSAFNGDTIRVADGTYKPGSGTATTVTFQLKNGVTIQGGYAGYGASDPNARDINANKSILSGLLSTSGSTSYYAQHIVTGSGTNSTAVLDGFTITQGTITSSTTSSNGLYNSAGSPTINNCTFQSIYNATAGAAIYNSNSSPTVNNCTLLENDSGGTGGAVYDTSSSAPKFTNCLISRNVAYAGGAIYNDTTSAAVFIGCTISWNVAQATGTGGGGVYNSNSASKFTNCIFLHNTGTSNGGAAYCTGAASPAFVQCVFDGNFCTSASSNGSNGGGGVYTTSASAPTFTNCTFTANSVPLVYAHGAAIYQASTSSAVTVVNSIFWGNTGPDATPIYAAAGSINVTYSDVQGGIGGTGNVSVDPVFANAAGVNGIAGDDDDDLRLRPGSAVADAGNNTTVGLSGITLDFAGVSRFAEIPTAPNTGAGTAPFVDMGAYEAQPGIVADPYGPYSVATGGSVTLNSYGYSDQPGSLSFAWDFNGDGQYDDATGPNPTFSAAGMTGPTTITIGLQITDGSNQTKTATVTLKVVPHAIYVDDSAPGANNGGSWADGYRSLASAMKDALPGCEIRVAQGTYYATDTNNSLDTMALKNGQQLVGGYAGYGAPDPNARNVTLYPTTVSGDIGTAGDITDNSNGLLQAMNLDDTALVDGFAFTQANDHDYWISGPGIYVKNASPTIRHCSFISDYGAAPLFVQDSSSNISDCLFELNSGSLLGGAVQMQLTPLSPSTPPRITDSIFVGNSGGWGGAVYFFDWSGKHSTTRAAFDGCVFSGNTLVSSVPSPDGSAMYIDSINGLGVGPSIANSIFWHNYALGGRSFTSTPIHTGASPTTTHCLGDSFGGTDPLFVRDPTSGADSIWGTADDDLGDVHLQSTSPAIDAGSNANVPSNITLDFDGNPRFADTPGKHDPGVIVDIGPFEATTTLAAGAASYQTPPNAPAIQVLFNENLDPASIQESDLSIQNVGTGAIIDGSAVTSPGYNSSAIAAVWTFTSPLPDGNYHATLAPASIMDADDHSSAGGGGVDFYFLAGDANHNRAVQTDDFWAIAANFNKTGQTYSQGDFNFDGKVNALDFNILAANFGARLAAPSAPVPLAVVESTSPGLIASPSLFSSVSIEDSSDNKTLIDSAGHNQLLDL